MKVKRLPPKSSRGTARINQLNFFCLNLGGNSSGGGGLEGRDHGPHDGILRKTTNR